MLRRSLRVAGRFIQFAWFCVSTLWDFWRTVRPAEMQAGKRDYVRRAEWAHRHARRLARVLRLRVESAGGNSPAQLFCANHLGYLDIVALVSVRPMVFVSKAEVQNWPVVGWLTQCAGTLYLQRERKGDLLEVVKQFDPIIAAEVPVVVFLEGTSSGGDDVLPFRPSLLAPAVTAGWRVAAVALDYGVSDGSVAQEVAYWRDMTFGPHFVNLLSKRWLSARVAFGESRPAGNDRKSLARDLREEVIRLRLPPSLPMD